MIGNIRTKTSPIKIFTNVWYFSELSAYQLGSKRFAILIHGENNFANNGTLWINFMPNFIVLSYNYKV